MTDALLTVGTAIVVFSIVIYPIGYFLVWAAKKVWTWQGRYM
jgi:hypothetical protein